VRLDFQPKIANKRICLKSAISFVSLKGEAIPVRVWRGPYGGTGFRPPEFQDNRHMKMAMLSVPRTGRLYAPGNTPGTHLSQRLCRPQGHSAARMINSLKSPKDLIENRTRSVPPVTAPTPSVYFLSPICLELLYCISDEV